jgi:hypothetical protein
MGDQKCSCEEDNNKDIMNYVLLGGIAVVIYLVMTKKC